MIVGVRVYAKDVFVVSERSSSLADRRGNSG